MALTGANPSHLGYKSYQKCSSAALNLSAAWSEHYTRLDSGAREVTGEEGSGCSCCGAWGWKYTPASLNWGCIGSGVCGMEVGLDSWYRIGTRTSLCAACAMLAASNSAASCLFHLFLLFWNHIFTWVSVRWRLAASPARSELLRYLFISKVDSSWKTCEREKTVRVFFLRLPRLELGSLFSSLSKSSLSSTSGSESWTSGCWGYSAGWRRGERGEDRDGEGGEGARGGLRGRGEPPAEPSSLVVESSATNDLMKQIGSKHSLKPYKRFGDIDRF